MKQAIVFTDAYGKVFTSDDHKYLYNSVHHYIINGWRVVQVLGTGGQSFNRGSFCFVLEQVD